MSEDLVEEPFRSAADRVQRAYEEAVSDAKSKVQNAKSAALKKVKQ